MDRKLAPFWRGLDDWSPQWAEHQLIAAARGLPIPAADETPDLDLVPIPPSKSETGQNINNLTVPLGGRTLSSASDPSFTGLSVPYSGPSKGVKPRAMALAAALSVGSRNASSSDLASKEVVQQYKDPFVNGQPLEVQLYKAPTECPICFLTYPPYLNQTRCCDQPICSECFVQIRRPDPHQPEHVVEAQNRDPNEGPRAEDPPETLISEPSACPYCQQPEFGVTYEPPPFRRGLFCRNTSRDLASTAMSSQTSLTSSNPPQSPSQPGRRRNHSLSANAPNVITTDRIRPDWSTKLASARSHQARRAAAATALHTAAFVVGNDRSLLRPGRFSRRNTGNDGLGTSGDQNREGEQLPEGMDPETQGQPHRSARRNRMDELEEMMLAEAVRLSLAAEEERVRKEEKAYRKEAKKREKEERKLQKRQGRDPYSGGASGASGSSLSLGLGRKRGNSVASNLRVEATVQGAANATKETTSASQVDSSQSSSTDDKGKAVDRGDDATSVSGTSALPITTAPSRGNSHLRQMSNASSIGSSFIDSPSGSYRGEGATHGASQSGEREGGDQDTSSEPLFNYRSLAEMVGVNLDDGSTRDDPEDENSNTSVPIRPLSQVDEEQDLEGDTQVADEPCPTIKVMDNPVKDEPNDGETTSAQEYVTTPELMITPGTPAVDSHNSEDKRLGHSSIMEHTTSVTQS